MQIKQPSQILLKRIKLPLKKFHEYIIASVYHRDAPLTKRPGQLLFSVGSWPMSTVHVPVGDRCSYPRLTPSYCTELRFGLMPITKSVIRMRCCMPRGRCLQVTSAYCTVSESAIMFIDSVIPIHRLLCEREAIYHRRREGDRQAIATEEWTRTLADWQASWEAETDPGRPSVNRKETGKGKLLDPVFFQPWVLLKVAI